jgi:hypothetical protein
MVDRRHHGTRIARQPNAITGECGSTTVLSGSTIVQRHRWFDGTHRRPVRGGCDGGQS